MEANYTLRETTTHVTSRNALKLSYCLNYLNLFQNNDVINSNNYCLDLFFSSFQNLQINRAADHLIDIEECHPPLDMDLSLNLENDFRPRNLGEKYNFHRGLYEDLNSYLGSIDWHSLFNNIDVNQDVKNLYDILYSAIETFIPLTIDTKNTFPPWLTSYIRFKIFEKKRAHLNYKTSRTPENYHLFSRLRAECETLIKNSYNNYCNEIENNLCKNPKSFWKYARSLRTDNNIPQSMSLNNVTYSNYSDSVNAFADHFRSVFSVPSNHNPNHLDDIDTVCDLNNVELSSEEILNSLNKLKIDRSPWTRWDS